MATITIPTPVSFPYTYSGTSYYLNDCIYNNRTEVIQDALGSDWTVDNKVLYYKGLPVLYSYTNSNTAIVKIYNSLVHNRGGSMTVLGQPSSNIMGAVSQTVYFYDFDSFIYISGYGQITQDIRYSGSGTDYPSKVVIDKTNLEMMTPLGYCYNNLFRIGGGIYNYIDENTEVQSCTSYPSQYAATYSTVDASAFPRKISSQDGEYLPVCGSDGHKSERFIFLTKFPNSSMNQVLHIGDKYIYVLPYVTYMPTSMSDYSNIPQQEPWCAIGIDVTDEIN